MSEDEADIDIATVSETVQKLKNSRNGHKGRLTYFKNKFAQGEFNSFGELQSVLHRIRITYTKFDEIQNELENIDPSSSRQSDDKYTFEDEYGILESAILDKIHSLGTKTKVNFNESNLNLDFGNKKANGESSVDTTVAIKLPQITLPKFDGTELTWLNFRDIYIDLIHANKSISLCTKFHYLVSSLRSGKAYHLIENLPITTENYEVAWKVVLDYYDNEISIQKLHVKALYDMKKPQDNSASSLQFFIDSIEKHFNALKSLKVDVNSWNLILIHHLSEKLDSFSRIEIVKKSPQDKLLTFSEFVDILKKRVKVLEAISQQKVVPAASNKNTNFKPNRVFVSQQGSCPLCKDNHTLNMCSKFCDSNCSPLQRFDIVKNLNLCTNCLSSGHRVYECKAGNCKRCYLKHHTLLHFEKSKPISTHGSISNQVQTPTISNQNGIGQKVAGTVNQPSNTKGTNAMVANVISSSLKPVTESFQSSEERSSISEVMLATAVLWVQSYNGYRVQCRALLDSGSQSSYITENLCQILNPIKNSTSIRVSGINGKVFEVKYIVPLKIQSRVTKYNANLNFLVLPKITGELPASTIPFDSSVLPREINLADPTFYINSKIDMLIGAEKYNEIVNGVSVKIIPELPPFQQTELGYIVLGKTNYKSFDSFTNSSSLLSFLHDELSDKINKFWEIEQISSPNILSLEEKRCEEHYALNTIRLANGRYSVALPTKSNLCELSDNKNNALKQFQYLERKLSNNPDMHRQYNEFIQEYIDLHQMQLVKDPDSRDVQSNQTYALPHHAVIKDSSTTTKLRVVFNASSKSASGISLNDCLMTGPTIQEDLFSLIIRFRKYLVALSADIIKMYRQILIHEHDRDLLRIYWRKSLNDELQCYRLCTVTYGTSSAPFQAIRTLKQLSIDERSTFPLAAKILETDFYVDDVLTGANSFEEAQTVKHDLIQLLASGGFELHKWNSNHSDLSDKNNPLQENSENIVSLLGLQWKPNSDSFQIIFKEFVETNKFCKRSILSEIAQLFDPLGLCAPVTVTAKLIMQSLWTTPSLSWDDDVSLVISEIWSNFRQQLPSMRKIEIPRCIRGQHVKSMELHGFADASEKAYGCVVYVRVTDLVNDKQITLLCAKSRVAPLKKQSIPRLELCAAVLLAQLVDKVVQCMDVKFDRICMWSDSEITIMRIKSCPSNYATFVANRISLIQDLSSIDSWMFVPTSLNPADLISRGLMPLDIISCKFWWNGPSFLNLDEHNWPKSSNIKINPELLELKRSKAVLVSYHNDVDLIDKFSDINKLFRVISICCRFFNNLRTPKDRRKYGELTSEELESARKRILKIVQLNAFSEDFNYIQKHKTSHAKSKLKSFDPFIDQDGLLRVGGRLKNADICYDNKHQIILSGTSDFTKKLVRQEHLRQLHAGPQALLYSLRLKYWIIGGRNLCRKVIHDCIRCFRTRPTTINQLMGQLPVDRVSPSRAFLNIGIDFCGPFNITHNLRKKIMTKVYVAVFICFCTKAVHMELVEDLSTQAFISSFRRFVARRGKCANVYSDNAINFIGAKAELKELHNLLTSEIHKIEFFRYLAEEQIQWHTIPPRSPHFGGLWEAAVKSAKHHLKRIIGNTSLRFEEFHTMVTQVEACLNSRPLTPMSNDVNDLQVLTPGHFIIGTALIALPDPSLDHLDYNRLSRWQRLQYMFQQFWKRWRIEYLGELQQRRKWIAPSDNISIGALVLLKEDNVPPLKWPLGRITGLHPGTDGYIRVATVKTISSELKRAISKLCVLPMEEKSSGADTHY